MIFGGTDAPCGNAALTNIGELDAEKNIKVAAKLYPLFESLLGIPNDRIYLKFESVKRSEM